MNKKPGPKNSNDKKILNRQEVVPAVKPEKRENIFSKSRDVREDRSARQMKTSRSSETFPQGR